MAEFIILSRKEIVATIIFEAWEEYCTQGYVSSTLELARQTGLIDRLENSAA